LTSSIEENAHSRRATDAGGTSCVYQSIVDALGGRNINLSDLHPHTSSVVVDSELRRSSIGVNAESKVVPLKVVTGVHPELNGIALIADH
jgi:hypothetical protein